MMKKVNFDEGIFFCSCSQMEQLNAFADFKYPNDIGPVVYDIHSPRVPTKSEMGALIETERGNTGGAALGEHWLRLKTRNWKETMDALIEMVAALQDLRKSVAETVR